MTTCVQALFSYHLNAREALLEPFWWGHAASLSKPRPFFRREYVIFQYSFLDHASKILTIPELVCKTHTH